MTHWIVVVTDLSGEACAFTWELQCKPDATVELDCNRIPSSACPDDINRKCLGYTWLTNEEISSRARHLIESHGFYNLTSNNCQHFARRLVDTIVDINVIEPDPRIPYRFRPEWTKFMGTLSSFTPGDILPPNEDVILIDVQETNRRTPTGLEVWSGVVQETGERVDFLRIAVQRSLPMPWGD